MPPHEFNPGFRFSFFDALLLAAGALGSYLVWSQTAWLAFVIAFVVGHFFLFCNVFRISRGLELIWAAVFILLTRATIASGHPTWMNTALLSLAVTVIVIVIEIRKPSYHGIGWSRLNPNLREWWKHPWLRMDNPNEFFAGERAARIAAQINGPRPSPTLPGAPRSALDPRC